MPKSLELKTNVNAESLSAEQLITDHIDIWTSAIEQKSSAGRGTSSKFSLYGIKKLRELILELAVRGKLVPQDPSDEPASALLERIAAEKAQLVKEGKLKKQKPLPEISENEKPFELPHGWEWSRLQDIIQISSGNNLTSKQMSADGTIPVYGGNGVTGYHDEFNVSKPTLVIGRVGFYCGSVHITPNLSWITDNAFITTFDEVKFNIEFLSWLFKATDLSENDSATAQPVISGRKVYPIVVAIPPTKEQYRIVAKVDELMLLCDALEAQTEASISAHQTLVETLLNALLLPNTTQQATTNASNTLADSLVPAFDNSDANSPEPSLTNSFEMAWLRIAEHFDTLFTTAASIDTLKQTILQLAVMGKLVEQASCEARNSPNYEPAAKLLERIAKEKAQLIKDGKIKKSISTDSIITENCDWLLAKGWLSAELQDICRFIDYRGKNPKKSSSGIRIITAKNIRNGFIKNEPVEYVSEELYEQWMVRGIPQKRDVLFITEGHTMGFVAQVDLDYKFALAQRTICLQRFSDFSPEYLRIALTSSQFQKSVKDNETGSAAGGIKASKLKRLKLSIPPLEEQYRIVAKVDELMALCDQLKARLTDAQSTQFHLTDAIVEQAI